MINPLTKNTANIQARYFELYRLVILFQGIFATDYARKLIEYISSLTPLNFSDFNIISKLDSTLYFVIKFYISCPLNFKKLKDENIVENIDSIIAESSDIYQVEDQFLYRINLKLKEFFENYIQWTKEAQNTEERKKYLKFIFEFLIFFHFEKVTKGNYVYIKPFIKFLLELNIDDYSMSPEDIESHKTSINTLGKFLYPIDAIQEIIEIIMNCLASSSHRVKENALRFYYYFYFNHYFFYKEQTLKLAINCLVEENSAIRKFCFNNLIDIFKVQSQTDLLAQVEESKKILAEAVTTKNIREICKSLQIMMALILSCPYEIEDWTEELLVLILKSKKMSKQAKETFEKVFLTQFLESHKGLANINQRHLSYEVYSELKEISNPSTYFA